MRVLIFAVLLSIVQTAPPVPRQTSNNPNQRADSGKKKAAQHPSPVGTTAPSQEVPKKAVGEQATTNQPTTPNAQQPIRIGELPTVSVARDWIDALMVSLTGILVIVTAIQAYLLCYTLKFVRVQSAIMRRQTRHIARQAQSMRYQTTHLKNSVEVAKISADAAKASADAAIASERAWVMVDLDKVPAVGFLLVQGAGLNGPNADVRIRCICSNQGKTPAKIIEKRAVLIHVTPDNPLPPIPNLDIEIQDPVPHYLQPGGEPTTSDWRLGTQVSLSEGGGDMVTFFVVYGIVKYRHLFSERIVHTTFGYRIRVDSVLERLIDYPKYNENT